MASRARSRSILPGFGLILGISVLYLSLMVLIPLSTLFLKTATLTWTVFREAVLGPRALASYKLSFTASFIAAVINCVFGLVIAWAPGAVPLPLPKCAPHHRRHRFQHLRLPADAGLWWGSASIQDAYMDVRLLPELKIRAGKFEGHHETHRR